MRASFDRGVLEVRIAKPEQRKPCKVAISVDKQSRTIEGTEAEGTAPEPVAAGS